MLDAEYFYVAIGHAERGSFSIEEVKAFIDASIRRFPDRKPLGIKASHAVIQNGLGDHYRDLGVSPQQAWYPGERVEVHFDEPRG